MANTLSDGTTTVALPDDIRWTDRRKSWAVGQAVSVTLGGSLIVEESKQLAGRPITLQSGGTSSPTYALMAGADVDLLLALANDVRADPLTLVWNGEGVEETFNVRFSGTDAVDAQEFKFQAPNEDADLYSVTLKLFAV